MPTKNTGFPLGPSLGYDSGLSCLFPRLCRNDFRQTKSLDRTRFSSQLTPGDRRPPLVSTLAKREREGREEGDSFSRETEEIFKDIIAELETTIEIRENRNNSLILDRRKGEVGTKMADGGRGTARLNKRG